MDEEQDEADARVAAGELQYRIIRMRAAVQAHDRKAATRRADGLN